MVLADREDDLKLTEFKDEEEDGKEEDADTLRQG